MPAKSPSEQTSVVFNLHTLMKILHWDVSFCSCSKQKSCSEAPIIATLPDSDHLTCPYYPGSIGLCRCFLYFQVVKFSSDYFILYCILCYFLVWNLQLFSFSFLSGLPEVIFCLPPASRAPPPRLSVSVCLSFLVVKWNIKILRAPWGSRQWSCYSWVTIWVTMGCYINLFDQSHRSAFSTLPHLLCWNIQWNL